MLVNEDIDVSQADSHILHPGSRALFRFWEGMRGADSAPCRTDLDLRQIRDQVPNLVMVERAASPAKLRWRLAGTQVCDLFRRELTGENVVEGWDSFEADVIRRFLNATIHTLQPCVLRFRLHTDHGQTIGAEMVGLPMLARDQATVHVFGGVFPFRESEALGYRRIVDRELSGARSIWTEHLPGDRLVRQLEKSQRQFRPFQVIAGGLS
ncbi:PAS domain-containing protein [Aestuariivirga sp.]|uniref:PAS domain-containing protein n=1 Tax=Aestuariivirga sp. TaxID=2650926 RepID=UPI0039E2DF5E